jgi:hypothetical protein
MKNAYLTFPANFAANHRLIYYSKKTNKQYDIENLIAENLELKRKLIICRDVLMNECAGRTAYETLIKMGEVNDTY